VTPLSRGTATPVAVIKSEGLDQFLSITGMGAGDSRGHRGFVYDRVILPLLLGCVYAYKDRQEAVLRASGLYWTLIRPSLMKSGKSRGRWRKPSGLSPVVLYPTRPGRRSAL